MEPAQMQREKSAIEFNESDSLDLRKLLNF